MGINFQITNDECKRRLINKQAKQDRSKPKNQHLKNNQYTNNKTEQE